MHLSENNYVDGAVSDLISWQEGTPKVAYNIHNNSFDPIFKVTYPFDGITG